MVRVRDLRTTTHAGPRAAAAVSAVVAALLALTGCSEVEERVGQAAEDAGCRVAQEAVDGVATQARRAADEIGADPAAAERELTALRDGLAAAEGTLSDETRQHVADARAALDTLVAQARAGAEGVVDETAVQEAETALDSAVEDLTQVC